jgi:hypothetical protein
MAESRLCRFLTVFLPETESPGQCAFDHAQLSANVRRSHQRIIPTRQTPVRRRAGSVTGCSVQIQLFHRATTARLPINTRLPLTTLKIR